MDLGGESSNGGQAEPCLWSAVFLSPLSALHNPAPPGSPPPPRTPTLPPADRLAGATGFHSMVSVTQSDLD